MIVGARGRHGYHPAGRAGSDVAQVDAAVVQEDVMSHAVAVLKHDLLASEGRGIRRKRLRAVLTHDIDRWRSCGGWRRGG